VTLGAGAHFLCSECIFYSTAFYRSATDRPPVWALYSHSPPTHTYPSCLVGLQIDVPSHASGFVPLIPAGVTFCDSTNTQLYNDPADNKTLAVVVTVLSAVAQAFPDALFHLGGDETAVVNGTACTYEYVATTHVARAALR
jgi:hypothetical protein